MKSLIRRLLRESLIHEKKIEVRPALVDMLQDEWYGRRLLMFLGSDEVRDDALVDYVDVDPDNYKKFIVGYTDKMGNQKTRSMGFGKFLDYLGADIGTKGYDIDTTVAKVKAPDISGMKLLQGPEMLKALSCDLHVGNLGSCMTSSAKSGVFQMFIENPRQVSALVSTTPEGMVDGRAFIWNTSEGLYMDKVYVPKRRRDVVAKFHAFAKKHDINQRGVTPDHVQLDKGGDYPKYPYMDTFIFYNPETGMLSSRGGPFILRQKDGSAKRV